jgi:fumarylacetoacetase
LKYITEKKRKLPIIMVSSWIEIPKDTDFSIHNFPFGAFRRCIRKNNELNTNEVYYSTIRCGSILGNHIIDLSVLEEADIFSDIIELQYNVFNQSTLNRFLEHSKSVWVQVRQRLIDLFTINTETSLPTLQTNILLQKAALINIGDVQLVLPIQIGDYTDFYSSREHATNVGIMFRGEQNALQPNWLHLPVGYHGRSSTVCISGTPIRRPCGQLEDSSTSTIDNLPKSRYGPSQQLDFELEVATVVGGKANEIGSSITIQQAKDRIFGFVLMNDWSARDIQKWEYVPLGPFTSKNFATTISPWIVMTEAFDTIPTSSIEQNSPTPLLYLQDPIYSSYNIDLSVSIQDSKHETPYTICNTNFKHMYWNSAQQLVHHAVTGCVMKAGDLLGSGTISGTSNTSFGSLLELSWKGTREVIVSSSHDVRTFLHDGDTVTMKGSCIKSDGKRVGFGDCTGTVLPPIIDLSGSLISEARSGEDNDEPSGILPNESNRYHDFVLYGYWRSSSTWRVRIALAAKSIQYKYIPVDLTKKENKSVHFLEKNPLGQVPLLEFTDNFTGDCVRLCQSLPIIMFLDESFPTTKSLIPNDTLLKAASMGIVEVINSSIQPWQNVFFLQGLAQQSEGKIEAHNIAKSVNESGLKVVEVLVHQYRAQNPLAAGPFCMGTFSPTVVDAYIVPQLYNARRFGVDVDSICPTLSIIDLVCSEHKWFQQSHPNCQSDAKSEDVVNK